MLEDGEGTTGPMKLRWNCRTATGKQDDAFGERAKADGANTDSSGMPAKMTMAVRQRID